MAFWIYNDRHDPVRLLKANDIEAALKEANKLIEVDGSYWTEDRFRYVGQIDANKSELIPLAQG